MSVLNIAGPEYDFGSVVYVVLQECEHRRRAFDDDELEEALLATATAKLEKLHAAYAEFGGSEPYWSELRREVLETAVPQYVDAAKEMNALERSSFGLWREGDPAARIAFALTGLFVGSLVIATPFIPVVEATFAFALTGAGFFFPEIKRYTHERRHYRLLNQLVEAAAIYQRDARLHYMTMSDIRESFSLPAPRTLEEHSEPPRELEK